MDDNAVGSSAVENRHVGVRVSVDEAWWIFVRWDACVDAAVESTATEEAED